MEDNNMLLDESHIDGSYQLRLKVKYLQEDKEKLQISNKEMKENIKLLRQINKELAKSNPSLEQSPLLKKLQDENHYLQASYLRIMQQNNALTCRNLMLEQIIQESQNQHIEILKGYQNKIIELRRSIQFKQSCIQSYEQNTNCNGNGYEVGNIPPSNVSMVFFNQIDSYKSTITMFENKVKELQGELSVLKDKYTKVEQEKTLIDTLISSRYGYVQFKQRLNNEINKRTLKAFSSQKNHNCTKKTQLLNKENTKKDKKSNQQKSKQTLHSSQPQQTREISYQCTSGNFKLNQLKDQLKKTNTDLTKLAINYRKQHRKRKQNDQKIRILLNSNKFYKQKRQSNADELNYYKRTTADLLRLIEKRKLKRTYSVDKTQVQQLIASIKKPQEIQLIKNNKKYWKKVQEQLKNRIEAKTKVDLETMNRMRLKKSFSDILDFSKMCHDDDNIHKYYFPKNTNLQNNKATTNLNKQIYHEKKNDLDDFSRILELGANGQIFDDQTLIIKAKPISYAERKKAKTKSKISDAHNLTIIRENIL